MGHHEDYRPASFGTAARASRSHPCTFATSALSCNDVDEDEQEEDEWWANERKNLGIITSSKSSARSFH